MSNEGYCEKYPPRLDGETIEQWVTRVDGPIPDTEHDEKKDFRCLNLPVRGSREDRESLGDRVYSEQTIRRMK
jgi:hypothetical protein